MFLLKVELNAAQTVPHRNAECITLRFSVRIRGLRIKKKLIVLLRNKFDGIWLTE